MNEQLFEKSHLDFFRSLEGFPGIRSHIVGSYVRDLAVGKVSSAPDIDLVVEEKAEEFAAFAATVCEGQLKRFPDFLTFKIDNPCRFPFLKEFDIATARTEIYAAPGALPEVKPATIENDLRRRDFTINSMALPIENLGELTKETLPLKIYDPFKGYADLERRIIRVLHDGSFIDDPTRLFRACRYAVRVGGSFDSGTECLISRAIQDGALNTISWFRILTELRKGLLEEESSKVFAKFEEVGLLENIPFVPPEAANKLAQDLLRVPSIKTAPDKRYLNMLRVISSYCGSEGKEALFRAANLSKEARNNILKSSGE